MHRIMQHHCGFQLQRPLTSPMQHSWLRSTRLTRPTPARAVTARATQQKLLWVQTSNQAVLTAAVESGHPTCLLPAADVELAAQWSRVVKFTPVFLHTDGALQDAEGTQVGRLVKVNSKEALEAAEATASSSGYLVMDASDWKVIPAENLVAAFQGGPGQLLGVASTAADGQVLLEALEAGTSGVLLRTEDPLQVKELAAYLKQRAAADSERVTYTPAVVTRVAPVGMGDRVCVDLCSMLAPGEGMLVGSFSRGLFLVHSECMESAYINSRPFRVNAGAVHAYLQAPGGRTSYLSELSSGSSVLVADAWGRTHTEVVGRIKLEARPLMLVEAQTPDGQLHSTLLQNAETVRLVGPSQQQQQHRHQQQQRQQPPQQQGSTAGAAGVATSSGSGSSNTGVGNRGSKSSSSAAQVDGSWVTLPVSELAPGDVVYVLQQEGARHTGISIQERVVEK